MQVIRILYFFFIKACASGPPEVSVTLLKNQNLPGKSEPLDEDQIPVDILLLTVDDCEFLGCLSFLNPSFRKLYGGDELGFVYLGDTGEDRSKLKIAVMKCHRGSITPGGSSVSAMDAIEVLRPKAVSSVGFCGGLDSTKVKPGDVVVSEKLITYSPSKVARDGIKETGVKVPLKSRLLKLIPNVRDGWSAPLENPKKHEEVKICCGAFLSGPEVIEDNKQCIALRNRFPEALAVEMEGEGKSVTFFSIFVSGVDDSERLNKQLAVYLISPYRSCYLIVQFRIKNYR